MKLSFSAVEWEKIFFAFFGGCRVALEDARLRVNASLSSVSAESESVDFVFVVDFLDGGTKFTFEEWRDWIVAEFKKAQGYVYETSLSEVQRVYEVNDLVKKVKISVECLE